MKPSKDVIPATLSFLLPGLGQLYLRRPARGAALFAAFTALNCLPGTRLFLVVPVTLASWDAYRLTDAELAAPARRKAVFLGVGFVAFLAWMGLLAMTVGPYREQSLLNAAATHLADKVRECRAHLGRYPIAIDECRFREAEWRRDPWGQVYGYRIREDYFEIRSAGRDGRWETPDDLGYRYEIRK